LPRRSYEQSPAIPVRLTPGGGLYLEPIPAFTGPIGRIAALAHYPFKAEFLGRSQQRQAVYEGLGCSDRRAAETLQQGLQARLALRKWLRPPVLPIEGE
jgi:hypothetical protein